GPGASCDRAIRAHARSCATARRLRCRRSERCSVNARMNIPGARKQRSLPRSATAQQMRARDRADAGGGRELYELKRALQVRNHALAVVTHDLNSPLSAISTLAHLVSLDPSLHSSTVLHMRHLTASARRMREMIDTLLDFARFDACDGIPIVPVKTDLGEVCRQALNELGAAHPSHAVTLEVRGAVSGCWDPARLSQ